MVSEKDLILSSMSTNAWEIQSLNAKLTVEKVMTKDVVTITEDTPLEEAASIMADRKIGGIPVMHGTDLVGLITESNIFAAFVETLGGRKSGIRIMATTSWKKGTLARIAGAIAAIDGDIVGFEVVETKIGGAMRWEITLKVQDVGRDALVSAVGPTVLEIIDVRET